MRSSDSKMTCFRRGLLAAVLLTVAACAREGGAPEVASAPRAAQPAWAQAGLSESEAIGIALRRFSFGPRPGDEGRVQARGLESWFEEQLVGELPETELEGRLDAYPALALPDAELTHRYPTFGMASAHARRFFDALPDRDEPVMDFSVISRKLERFAAEQGLRNPEEELYPQLRAQKMTRAIYAENQLREVMTEFWQNHFYTGLPSFSARPWLLSYERSVLRPGALGRFEALLQAAVQHPGLLEYYGDAAEPVEAAPEETLLGHAIEQRRARRPGEESERVISAARAEIAQLDEERDLILKREFWPKQGPNRVRARALLELHTLGPDGPHSEADVRALARLLTGWSAAPRGASPQWFAGELEHARALGFAGEGGFLFRADWHDARPKQFLGVSFPEGGGVEEGERALALLAAHPSTASHVARAFGEYFCCDAPPAALLEGVAQRFTASGGEIREALRALVASPEFWREAAKSQRIKSPLQYAASAVRWLGPSVEHGGGLAEWTARMGQPLYGYLEADGYPGPGSAWLDPGALLSRLQFARTLLRGEVEGVAARTAAYAATAGRDPSGDLERIAGPGFQRH